PPARLARLVERRNRSRRLRRRAPASLHEVKHPRRIAPPGVSRLRPRLLPRSARADGRLHAVAAVVLHPPDAHALAVHGAVHAEALAAREVTVAAEAAIHAMDAALAPAELPGLAARQAAATHALLDASPLHGLSSMRLGRGGLRRARSQTQRRGRDANQSQLVN